MAIISPAVYNEYLARIAASQQAERVSITMPENSKICEVNLETRKIDSLDFITVQSEHFAETIYFKVDRYFGPIDLIDTICVVEFINANNQSYTFPVPFYDIETYGSESKILIPWILEGNVTAAPGLVQFALKFYRINTGTNKYEYCLKTLPGKLIIQNDLDVDLSQLEEEYEYNYTTIDNLIKNVNDMIQSYKDSWDLYWEDV